MMTIPDTSFPFFITLWNRMQGMTTPAVHIKIASWMDRRYMRGDTRLLLMAFRACGKSTLVGLYCAWRLMLDPDLRILVLSADEQLAIRMVRNVRRIIEKHPLTSALRPDNPDQWAMDRFTVRRAREWPDASMTARGLGGNITGLRADLVICDDVEVPNTSDTSDRREELRARLAELSYVCTPSAHIIYVGTPHAFDTIYTTCPRSDIPGHVPFLSGYQSLRLPVMDKNGHSIWPEKFSDNYLSSLKKSTGTARFDSQMMLRPMNITESFLKPADVIVYDLSLTPVKELGQLYIGEAQIASCSAWWDPSYGAKGGDGSALAVVFTDTRGHVWLHHLSYITVPEESGEDAATYQCGVVARTLRDLHVPIIGVETNGLGRFLPAILRREIVRARAGAAVIEHTSRLPKRDRILNAFTSPLAARMLHVHADVMRGRFADEMRDWSPVRSGCRDDGLDAAAGAILMEPVRLPREGATGQKTRPFWR